MFLFVVAKILGKVRVVKPNVYILKRIDTIQTLTLTPRCNWEKYQIQKRAQTNFALFNCFTKNIQKVICFLKCQLAQSAPVLLRRAVNRQPGFRSKTRRAGSPCLVIQSLLSAILVFSEHLSDFAKISNIFLDFCWSVIHRKFQNHCRLGLLLRHFGALYDFPKGFSRFTSNHNRIWD